MLLRACHADQNERNIQILRRCDSHMSCESRDQRQSLLIMTGSLNQLLLYFSDRTQVSLPPLLLTNQLLPATGRLSSGTQAHQL